jgi:hypothetical protein
MAANYRYWCGECRYRTPWLTESEGADSQLRHYAQRHSGIEPGGRVEVRTGSGGGAGCLALVGLLFVVLLLAATCQPDQSTGAPAPHGVVTTGRAR